MERRRGCAQELMAVAPRDVLFRVPCWALRVRPISLAPSIARTSHPAFTRRVHHAGTSGLHSRSRAGTGRYRLATVTASLRDGVRRRLCRTHIGDHQRRSKKRVGQEANQMGAAGPSGGSKNERAHWVISLFGNRTATAQVVRLRGKAGFAGNICPRLSRPSPTRRKPCL